MDAWVKAVIGLFNTLKALGPWWLYVPKWWLGLGSVAAIIWICGVAYFRFWDPERGMVGSQISARHRVKALVSDGFKPIHRIPPVTRLKTKAKTSFVMRGRSLTISDVGVRGDLYAFVTHEKNVIVTVFTPFQGANWDELSALKFSESRNPADLLSSAEFRPKLAQAQHLVCVGLSSREVDDDSRLAMNERLSKKRAENLCLVAASSVGQGRSYWGWNLGYARTKATSDTMAENQRKAIIIGLIGASPDDVPEALRDVVQYADRVDVNLGDYSLSGNVSLIRADVKWGDNRVLEEFRLDDVEN